MPVIDLGRVIGPQGPQGATGAQGIRGEQGLPGPNQVTNSTATPLTGVLVGNGSVVGVEDIDEVPTANSTGFVTSGAVKEALDGNQAQLATIESGTTASRYYPVGKLFCWNGLLYRAIVPISSGQAFNPGTNCEQTDIENELSLKCRSMTITVPAEKSVDVVVTGTNYAPNHGFLLVSTGNNGVVMGIWLCYGFGIRSGWHFIIPLHTSGGTSISVTTDDGKYTFTNTNNNFAAVISVVVLQEVGTQGYLSLSSPY